MNQKSKEKQLIALLKKIMWQDYGDPDHHNPDNDNCVFCGAQRRDGHRKKDDGYYKECPTIVLIGEQ